MGTRSKVRISMGRGSGIGSGSGGGGSLILSSSSNISSMSWRNLGAVARGRDSDDSSLGAFGFSGSGLHISTTY